MLKFNIFGKLIGVASAAGSWDAYYLGPERKRRPADFVIPNDVTVSELCEYLADLFHENATPRNNSATRIV